MNQKEQFVQALTTRTRNNEVSWKTGTYSGSLSKYIANFDMVSQIFLLEQNGNEIYFVVHKCMRYSGEIDMYVEHFEYYILILSMGNLVYSVNENEVYEDMLGDLFVQIRSNHEKNFSNTFVADFIKG